MLNSLQSLVRHTFPIISSGTYLLQLTPSATLIIKEDPKYPFFLSLSFLLYSSLILSNLAVLFLWTHGETPLYVNFQCLNIFMLTCCFFLSKDFKGVFRPHLGKINFSSNKRLIIAQQQSAVKLNIEEELRSRNTSRSFPEVSVQLGFFVSSAVWLVPEIKKGITPQWRHWETMQLTGSIVCI